jgi:glycosyltransferase involved in cell wall biosynthesis
METQGLVAQEAMAMKKTVVFTKLGPGPEIIKDYKTGLLCDPHNPSAIAEKIIWVFDNKSEAQQMALEARKDILKRFDIKKMIEKNIQFYLDLIVQNQKR